MDRKRCDMEAQVLHACMLLLAETAGLVSRSRPMSAFGSCHRLEHRYEYIVYYLNGALGCLSLFEACVSPLS